MIGAGIGTNSIFGFQDRRIKRPKKFFGSDGRLPTEEKKPKVRIEIFDDFEDILLLLTDF